MTFDYKANAAALGGILEKPFPEVLETPVSVALPISGGRESRRVSHYDFRGLISFSSAEVSVLGGEGFTEHQPGRKVPANNTLITAVIENLNILGLVTADRIVARLTSEHVMDTRENPNYQPAILPIGSHFVNLRIAGCPVPAPIHPGLARYATPVQLRDGLTDQDEHARAPLTWLCELPDDVPYAVRERFGPLTGLAQQFETYDNTLPELRGTVPAHLFDLRGSRKELESCGASVYANAVHVPHFGTIFIGDYFITPFSRRLTMLRVKLGCSMRGDVSVCPIEGNGSHFP